MKVKGFNSGQRKPVLLSSASSHVEGRAIQPISRQPCLGLGEKKPEKLGSSLVERREMYQRQEKELGWKCQKLAVWERNEVH